MQGEQRRGVFRAGERVQLTDNKGRHYTISLTRGGYFQSTRGNLRHDAIIGQPEGSVLESESGRRFLALRPLLSDYVLSMPRGATVVYPKDSGQIITEADIFPGARVFEAGAGSGALSITLIQAAGSTGRVVSAEQREDFAEIAAGNVRSWLGTEPTTWDLRVGDASAVLGEFEPGWFDIVVLDMLAPWEHVPAITQALRPGGVVVVYVTTTTQLSRFAETVKTTGAFTEPISSETMRRTWHTEGLAVRPDHRMIGHTGFLCRARRLAADAQPLRETRRPAKGAYAEPVPGAEGPKWTAEDFGEREIAPKKLRKVRRDVAHRADVEASGESSPGPQGAKIAEKLAAEAAARTQQRAHD
ncbi:tRNA (adenine(58)-N(1))-methyltransferase TrmI [Actinobaculum suis]|uniref:tRNA (Adenine(58)-N(1))-methyltransferase TrmI n=1 Tax=Actinobaculum suis TaxID=1657 RepID=A0A7Z8YA39_9ACTO|nr:tRNA (adenine-N1)-methyltransferase [Actinobaculum suis]VDG76514.1 tRNA (adenine(58)-N(1))-methyltransferase TrmI [Actinobaculum suis]